MILATNINSKIEQFDQSIVYRTGEQIKFEKMSFIQKEAARSNSPSYIFATPDASQSSNSADLLNHFIVSTSGNVSEKNTGSNEQAKIPKQRKETNNTVRTSLGLHQLMLKRDEEQNSPVPLVFA